MIRDFRRVRYMIKREKRYVKVTSTGRVGGDKVMGVFLE